MIFSLPGTNHHQLLEDLNLNLLEDGKCPNHGIWAKNANYPSGTGRNLKSVSSKLSQTCSALLTSLGLRAMWERGWRIQHAKEKACLTEARSHDPDMKTPSLYPGTLGGQSSQGSIPFSQWKIQNQWSTMLTWAAKPTCTTRPSRATARSWKRRKTCGWTSLASGTVPTSIRLSVPSTCRVRGRNTCTISAAAEGSGMCASAWSPESSRWCGSIVWAKMAGPLLSSSSMPWVATGWRWSSFPRVATWRWRTCWMNCHIRWQGTTKRQG